MRLTRPRLRLLTVAAIGGGAAVALALPAGAAVSVASQSPPVQAVRLGDTATLDAKGAVAFAPLQLLCPTVPQGELGYYFYLSVSITENVGGGSFATGTTTTGSRSCNDTPLQLQVAVTPTLHPFKKGTAVGQASLQICQDNFFVICHTIVDQHDIELVKP